MKNLNTLKINPIVLMVCLALTTVAYGQNFTTVLSFDGTHAVGGGALVQGFDGSLYSVGALGAHLKGNVFRISPSGQVTSLYSFCAQTNCPDGWAPNDLVLGPDGNFYGSTDFGGSVSQPACSSGSFGCGTVFKVTPAGRLTTLHTYCTQSGCPDGTTPQSALVLGPDGNFYGTTSGGGTGGGGTVFKITPTGELTTLYSFVCDVHGVCADGQDLLSSVAFGRNGNLFGAANYGGSYDSGTLFELTPSGNLNVLYNFNLDKNSSNGPHFNGFTLASDGNLYGTMASGGTCLGGCGAILKVSESGRLGLFHFFCREFDCPDGTQPFAPVIQGTDGNLYGSTFGLGGTLFQITLDGNLTTLHAFCAQSGCPDGTEPTALVQATNGVFYGTASQGGTSSNCGTNIGCGTLFSVSMGLAPFAEAIPSASKAGATVSILGNNLTGTTSVTFNGTRAAFKVVSNTLLKAQVPSGAITGAIQVTTTSGVLSSNNSFQVLP